MASFTGVGDNVTLQMTHKGDTASVALLGTYSMTIALQREVGSPGSGAYVELKRWSTADATVTYDYVTEADNEKLRLIVLVDTSGTCTATLSDNSDLVLKEDFDPLGNIQVRWYQSGPVFYNASGQVVLDLRQDEKTVAIADAATYTVLPANSGKTHYLPDLAADIAITMPAAADGLEFEFVYKGVAADTKDWNFDFGSDTNFLLGGVLHADTDAGTGAAEAVAVNPDGNSNSKMNVLTPDVGTRVRFRCDGTNWLIDGVVTSASAPTFADQ